MAIVSKNIAARNDCFSSFKTPNNRFITLKYLLNLRSLSILSALKILKSTSNSIGSNPDNTANRSIIAGHVEAYFNLVISLLNETGFGTKNLPDAFNWHCAYFWEHINKKIRNKEVTNCYNRLLKCIAIPILVSRPIIDYKNLASYINECSE